MDKGGVRFVPPLIIIEGHSYATSALRETIVLIGCMRSTVTRRGEDAEIPKTVNVLFGCPLVGVVE